MAEDKGKDLLDQVFGGSVYTNTVSSEGAFGLPHRGLRQETTTMPSPIHAPDLTQRPPRSPRCRLGGFVLLPRMLDKARATAAGKQGEYHYNCPIDQHILNFLGLDPEALMTEIKAGKGDGEILEWALAAAKHKRAPWEIEQWSAYHDKRGPDSDAETLPFFAEKVGELSQTREDIKAWFDLLDTDDHVTFGGGA
jgi:hypothetical protein